MSAQTENDSVAVSEQPQSSGSKSDPLETAKWTRYLPEAFGIRESVRESSYRWCVREGWVLVGSWLHPRIDCNATVGNHSTLFFDAYWIPIHSIGVLQWNVGNSHRHSNEFVSNDISKTTKWIPFQKQHRLYPIACWHQISLFLKQTSNANGI